MPDLDPLVSAQPVKIVDADSTAAVISGVPTGDAAGLVVREAIRGQAVMSGSVPVTIASNQSALNVILSGASTVTLSGASTVSANQGTAGSVGQSWYTRLTDGTNSVPVTSGTPIANDYGLVVRTAGSTTVSQGNATGFVAQSWYTRIADGTNSVTLASAQPSTTAQSVPVREVARGQQTMTNSIPVTVASNQSSLSVNLVGTSMTQAVSGTVTVSGTVNATQGVAGTVGQSWYTRIADGTNSVTLASAAPATAAQAVPVREAARGQTTMANSIPVTIASNQSAQSVDINAVNVTTKFPQIPITDTLVSGYNLTDLTSPLDISVSWGGPAVILQVSGAFIADIRVKLSWDGINFHDTNIGGLSGSLGLTAVVGGSGGIYIVNTMGAVTVRVYTFSYATGTAIIDAFTTSSSTSLSWVADAGTAGAVVVNQGSPASNSAAWPIKIVDTFGNETTLASAQPATNAYSLVTREVARGQQTMTNSIPVTVASNQSALSVNIAGASMTQAVSGTVTSTQGNAGSVGQSWYTRITDGTNSIALASAAPATSAYALPVRTVGGGSTVTQGNAGSVAESWYTRIADGTNTVTLTGNVPASGAMALPVREVARGPQTITGSIPVTMAIDQAPMPDNVGGLNQFSGSGQASTIPMAGYSGASVEVTTTTLVGTIRFTMASLGSTTLGGVVQVYDVNNRVWVSSVTNPTSNSNYIFPSFAGCSHVGIECSAYTSGTFTFRFRRTTNSAAGLMTNVSISGAAAPANAAQIAGIDPSNVLRVPAVISGSPATDAYALAVRTVGGGSTVTQGNAGSVAESWYTRITDGSNGPAVVSGGMPAANAASLVVREAARGPQTITGSVPVTLATDQSPGSDSISATFTLSGAGQSFAQDLNGYTGAAVEITASTMSGRIAFRVLMGGSIYRDVSVYDVNSRTWVNWIQNPSNNNVYIFPVLAGIRAVAVSCTQIASGSVDFRFRRTNNHLTGMLTCVSISGAAAPENAMQIAGIDGSTNLRVPAVINSTAFGSEYGMVTREAAKGQQAMTGSIPVVVASDQSAISVSTSQPALSTTTGTITTSTSTVSHTNSNRYGLATVTINGTYAGVNVTFEASDDSGTNWYSVEGVRSDNTASEGTSGALTNTGRAWYFNLAGGNFTNFRVRATAYTSGTANIKISTAAGSGAKAIVAQGDTPHGSTDGGSPVKIGGVARLNNPGVLSDGQRVDAMFDRIGRIVTSPMSVRALTFNNYVAITGVAETVIASGSAGFYHDLIHLQISNAGVNDSTVTIKESFGGSTRMVFRVAASGGGALIPFSAPFVNNTQGGSWTATASITGSLHITTAYIRNI